MARSFSPEARLGRWLQHQQQRVERRGETILARYRRRIATLEPQPTMETRGLSQPWHRLPSDQQRRLDE